MLPLQPFKTNDFARLFGPQIPPAITSPIVPLPVIMQDTIPSNEAENSQALFYWGLGIILIGVVVIGVCIYKQNQIIQECHPDREANN